MPTGYTADVGEGKTTFEEFVLTCARAFGATIMQRDEPIDVPPRIVPMSDYHERALTEAKNALAELRNMTDEDFELAAEREFLQATSEYHKRLDENKRIEDNYRSMLSKVKNWDAPTEDHQNLKQFMIEQLESSIDFDCKYVPTKPTLLSADEYKRKRKESVLNNIEYHKVEAKKERERYEMRKNWIVELYRSLNLPEPTE